MPEGHTIRRQLLDQRPAFIGQTVIATSPSRRFESGAAALSGRVCRSMDAWGKHLFYFFDGRRVLHVHLGLEGGFRLHRSAVPPARRSALLRLATPGLTVDLVTPQVCAVIDELGHRAEVARLGPDPLRDDADPSVAIDALLRYPGEIGAAVLDQSVIAGIGNIYRAEILFALGIHPGRPAAAIGAEGAAALWATAARMLAAGVAHRGNAVTVDPRDLRVRDRRTTWVYGQRLCARCGGAIRRWEVAGRLAYACETCQPPSR